MTAKSKREMAEAYAMAMWSAVEHRLDSLYVQQSARDYLAGFDAARELAAKECHRIGQKHEDAHTRTAELCEDAIAALGESGERGE
jgi:hypothetical protein